MAIMNKGVVCLSVMGLVAIAACVPLVPITPMPSESAWEACSIAGMSHDEYEVGMDLARGVRDAGYSIEEANAVVLEGCQGPPPGWPDEVACVICWSLIVEAVYAE